MVGVRIKWGHRHHNHCEQLTLLTLFYMWNRYCAYLTVYTCFKLRKASLRELETFQVTWACVSCTWQNTWRLVAYADRDVFFLQRNSVCWWLLGSLQQLDSLSTGFCSLCQGAVMLLLSWAASLCPREQGNGEGQSRSVSFILQTKALWETSSRLQPTVPC